MNISKVLALGLIALTIGGCGKVVNGALGTPDAKTADAYVLVFVAHTAAAGVPVEQTIGLAARPALFVTQDACETAKAKLVASFDSEEGKTWFTQREIDKKVVTCTPIRF